MEQVIRVLNVRTATWLRRRRRTSDTQHALDTIRYRQTRNAAARDSRTRHRPRRTRQLFAL